MTNLKNRLNIYIILIYSVILSFNMNAVAENATIPQSGIITGVSDKLALSVKDNPIKLELPYLYIPNDLLSTSTEALKIITVNQEFNFNYITNKLSRNGNLQAILIGKNNKKPVHELLLEKGLAFVYFIDAVSDTKPLFVAEKTARKSKAGVWHDDNFSIINSSSITEDYNKYLNHFIIIQGVVNNIYTSKKNTYLNFGEDWKTDFSVQLENKTLKRFHEFKPDQLKGKKVRVRGWLENYNGPFMKILNPANIEIE